jgi:hypothetical protein
MSDVRHARTAADPGFNDVLIIYAWSVHGPEVKHSYDG